MMTFCSPFVMLRGSCHRKSQSSRPVLLIFLSIVLSISCMYTVQENQMWASGMIYTLNSRCAIQLTKYTPNCDYLIINIICEEIFHLEDKARRLIEIACWDMRKWRRIITAFPSNFSVIQISVSSKTNFIMKFPPKHKAGCIEILRCLERALFNSVCTYTCPHSM